MQYYNMRNNINYLRNNNVNNDQNLRSNNKRNTKKIMTEITTATSEITLSVTIHSTKTTTSSRKETNALCYLCSNNYNFVIQMARTRDRPLVRGQLSPLHAATFAFVSASVGTSVLYFGVNEIVAGKSQNRWIIGYACDWFSLITIIM